MMRLYLDDLRNPSTNHDWMVVRSYEDAVRMCADTAPHYVSFDHDLGDEVPTGYDFAKWLVERDLDADGTYLPEDFKFNVHSANPVGTKNIEGLLTDYLKKRLTK